jgi:hypothetical protein
LILLTFFGSPALQVGSASVARDAGVALAWRGLEFLRLKFCGDEGEVYDLGNGRVVRDSETGEVIRVVFLIPRASERSGARL